MYAGFDGENFNRHPVRFIIKSFEGTKIINSLRCYPLDYHERKEDITTSLLARGKRFRSLCIKDPGQQMTDYDGNMYYCSELPEDIFGDEHASSVLMGSIMGIFRGSEFAGEPKDIVGMPEIHPALLLTFQIDETQKEQDRAKVFDVRKFHRSSISTKLTMV
jgi:hypothetical protein